MRGHATDTVQPDVEAKVLGLNQDVNEIDVARKDSGKAGGAAAASGGARNNLKRKETLTKSGKLDTQQVVGIGADGKAVTTTQKEVKVETVGKEGSACCSIF